MASDLAWQEGWQIGSERATAKRAHKEEHYQQQIKDLLDQRDALQQKFSSTLDAHGQWTDASAAVNQDILKNQAAILEFYHPDNNPGAIAKYGRLLMERMHMVKPQQATSQSVTSQPTIPLPQNGSVALPATPGYAQATVAPDSSGKNRMTTAQQPGAPAANIDLSAPEPATDTMAIANPKGLVKPGNLPIWNRPSIKNDDGSHSSEYSVSFADQDGHEVLVPTVVDGKFLTPDGKKPPEGSKEEKAMFARAWQHYLKTGQNLGMFDNPANADAYAQELHSRGQRPGMTPAGPQTTVVGPAMTPHQRDQFNKKQQVIQSRTSALEAAAPVSPEQVAAQARRIAEADSRASIDSMKETFHRLVPNPTPEQQDQFDSMVLQAALGIKPTQQAGNWVEKPGHLKDGTPATLLYNSKDGTYKTRTGEEVSQEVLAQWTEDAKPTKMTANDRLWDAYAATLHKTTDQLTMQDKPGFELWLNGLKMRSTNRQAIIYDRDGDGYIIDLTSTSGPVEVGVIPKGGTAPSASSGAGAPPSATPGAGRAPSTPSHPGGTGGVGLPHLIHNFKKSTPDYTKAKNTYEDANRVSVLADQWIQHPSSEADKNFVLALIRSEAGRVNQQEIQMMMGAGGAGMYIPRALANLTTGELPPELRKQLVDFVHLQRDAAKQVLDEMNAPPPNASPSGPQALPPGW